MSSDEYYQDSSSSCSEYRYRREKPEFVEVKFSSIKPFHKINAEFKVRENLKKFFVKYEDVQEHRKQWSDLVPDLSQSSAEEMEERHKASKLILGIGKELSVNQATIETSMVYMHRFYIFHPIKIFPYEVTAAAAFSVGAKSRYNNRHSRHVIKALMKVLKRPLTSDDIIDTFVKEMFEVELCLAITLGHEYSVELPAHYIKSNCKDCQISIGSEEYKTIERVALDSLLMTTFCIRFPTELIATFCIFQASKALKKPIQSCSDLPFHQLNDPGITVAMLEVMSTEFMRRTEGVSELATEIVQMEVLHDFPVSKRHEQPVDLQPAMPERKVFRSKSCNGNIPMDTEVPREKFGSERNAQVAFVPEKVAIASELTYTKSSLRIDIENMMIMGCPEKATPNTACVTQKNPNLAPPTIPLVYPSTVCSATGIKSTVPMKIKPIKPPEKDESDAEMIRLILDDIPETFSTNKVKQRISRVVKPLTVQPIKQEFKDLHVPKTRPVDLDRGQKHAPIVVKVMPVQQSIEANISKKPNHKKSKKAKHSVKHPESHAHHVEELNVNLPKPSLKMVFKRVDATNMTVINLP